MKIFVIFLALLLIIPLAHSQVQVENSASFRIGYSSEKLFSSDLGMLSYVRGETIWLQVSGSHMIELHNKEGIVVSGYVYDGRQTPIYTFEESDILGTWRLIIDNSVYELELVDQSLEVEENIVEFLLMNDSLIVKGEIRPIFTDIPLESEIIIAKNRKSDFTTVQTELVIERANTNIGITYNVGEKETTLFIQPYIDNIRSEGEYSEIGLQNIYAWAELTSEIALVKKTESSRFTTYVDEPIVETDRTYFEITDVARKGINMTIPGPGLTDEPWTVPLKYGRALLSVYLEFEGQIFVNRIPVIILEDKIIINPELIIPVSSFEGKIEYREIISIEENMELEFLLISKINGIDRIFYDTDRPALTKINVIDRTNNEKLDKYNIVFEENVEAIKINQTTYIIGNQELINNFASSWSITNAKLFINSFSILDSILDSRMNEDGTIEIIANVGIARIQVIDSTGSISGNGEIVIRKLGSDMEEFLITEWNGSDVKIILPEGRYLARLESENIQGETEFEISMDDKEVLIIVDSMYGMSTNIWIFILSTIITIEIVIIYTIWKKNIKGI